MNGAAPNLLTIPDELNLEIVWCLRPPDLLSLRSTCKKMWNFIPDELLWKHKLKEMCEENAVFLPTYRFDNMSAEQLQDAVMRPYKLIRLLERSDDDNKLSYTNAPSIAIDPNDVPDLYLVPGGRYLFLFFRQCFGLLDLECFKFDNFTYSIVAVVNVFNGSHVVSSTPNGDGLRVVISGYNSATSQTELNVFDILPSMQCIASLTHPGRFNLDVCSVCGNFVVLRCEKEMQVWNFVTQKATSWKITVPPCCYRLTVTESTVAFIISEKILIWRIPDLLDNPMTTIFGFNGQQLPLLAEINAKSTFASLNVDSDCFEFVNVPCDWYKGTVVFPDELFDNLHVDIATIFRFQLDSKNLPYPPTDSSARYQPSLIQKLEVQHDYDELYVHFQPLRIVNSRPVCVWHEEHLPESDDSIDLDHYDFDADGVIQMISSWSTKIHIGPCETPNLRNPGKQTTLFEDLPIEPTSFTFCPVSGRFCYYSQDKDKSNSCIRILSVVT